MTEETETEAPEEKLSENPPDRLSLNPRSKFFDGDMLQRGVGIRFKGKERFNVEEYCISESWIRVQAGKSRDRHGNPMTIRLDGPVEAWFRDSEDNSEEE
ncbi:MAG: DUF3297 family protein [Acidobacteriota bacterium]